MKILAIYRHYWPDTTPYSRLLRAIVEQLADDGHQASVFTAQPSYNDITHPHQPRRETLGGVEVMRVGLLPEQKRFKLLRAINFAWFLTRAICHVILRGKYDLIIANGHPPVLMGVALRCIRWWTGVPYLLHLQDIHPESAEVAGQIRKGWLSRSLLRQDIANCGAAQCIVTLSEDMRAMLLARDSRRLQHANIQTINNFPLDVYRDVDADELPTMFREASSDTFRVLFAGNLGHFQQLERLVDAARLLEDASQIQFVFMGAGAVRNALEQQAGDLVGRTIFFEPYQPVEVAVACMKRCDLGVISLAPDVYRVAYPSKTMTYLSAGLPILAIVEAESNVAGEIVSNDFGYLPATTTQTDIAASIRKAYEDRQRWTSAARSDLATRSEAHFGRQRAMDAWSGLMQQLDPQQTSAREAEVSNAIRQAA